MGGLSTLRRFHLYSFIGMGFTFSLHILLLENRKLFTNVIPVLRVYDYGELQGSRGTMKIG